MCGCFLMQTVTPFGSVNYDEENLNFESDAPLEDDNPYHHVLNEYINGEKLLWLTRVDWHIQAVDLNTGNVKYEYIYISLSIK